MQYQSRKERLAEFFPDVPKFRQSQLDEALFKSEFSSWNDVTNFPVAMREKLTADVPWTSLEPVAVQNGEEKDVYKASLSTFDGQHIETVLMKNARDAWTVCVSSQVGCAMRCAFCATGKMGLTRSLHSDEIVDQYRFWVMFLSEKPELNLRISNIVFMGMGEPMANYENVRDALNILLANTSIGPTHMIVSSVGVIPRLEQMLSDEKWPHIRMAISLHSADSANRMKLMPTSYPKFHADLADWARRYLAEFGNRRHHLTFEYVMLAGVNDTDDDAKKLASYVTKIGDVRVNLIPFNTTEAEFTSSSRKTMEHFQSILDSRGVTVTIRKSLGTDFDAACGQLAAKKKHV
ncbi:MAG: 23S rRNA (adenine(2503)-C(2))-methyltransferase RlmN [Patescibacteria group bacterium]|jgi:adenine C2-methylase RlmN of 23S rRNA A2503 and tRNA A37